MDEIDLSQLAEEITAAIKTVYDPEIPVDIYELGLIYKVDVEEDGLVKVLMTLTAPNCPMADKLPIWVQEAIAMVPGVQDVKVDLTFDPPWSKEMMSEEAQVALNIY